MTTVLVASQKGGCGKTPIVIHGATYLHSQGVKVAIADYDPQKTATSWRERGERAGLDLPPVEFVDGDTIARALREFSRTHNLIFIDTPGVYEEELADGLAVADVLLIPVATRPADVETGLATYRYAEEIRARHRLKFRTAMALTLMRRDTNLAAELAAEVRKRATCPVFKAELHVYNDYDVAHAIGTGLTLHSPGSIAAEEMAALMGELQQFAKQRGRNGSR